MQAQHIKQADERDETQSLAARVIARGVSRRPPAALSSALAGLATDARHPVALELASDERGVSALLRATDEASLAHLTHAVQALYPQAELRPLARANDPLRLARGEAVTVLDLTPRGQPYLSLATRDERAWAREETVGDDPLLAVLGAMQSLPPDTRAIAQLALVPAHPQWAKRFARYAVQHPLEPERARERRLTASQHSRAAPSGGMIIALGMVIVLALIARRFGTVLLPLVPAWVRRDALRLARGHAPSLTPPQITQLALLAGGLFLVVFAISRLWLRLRGSVPLYDMRQVGAKQSRPASRARLRLYVIGPAARIIRTAPQSPAQGALHYLSARRAETRRRRAIAARLAAAYRQYDNPAGAVLAPRLRHGRAAHLVARMPARPVPLLRARRLARRLRARHPQLAATTSIRREDALVTALGQWPLIRLLRWLILGRARWQRGTRRSPCILSVDEVAALWHLLPEQDAPDVAGLERGLARTRPLPPQLATAFPSSVLPALVGECRHAGQVWPVFPPRDLFHQNSLAVAATGKGKSTLFAHLALAHLSGHPQEGLFFMEPHGDTIAQLLGSIPSSRRDDVTLIDLSDERISVSLNPLDMTQGRSRDKTVENILSVFIAFWQKQKSWGARTENILQFCLLALAEANERRIALDGEEAGAFQQYTLLDVVPLLQQRGFRDMVLADVRDLVVLDWWRKYYEPLRQSFRDEITSSIINKISKYAAAKVSRRLLGQSQASVRISEEIALSRAMLVNTASGVVGEEVSALVGATLVGLFHTTLAEQIRLSRENRRRVWIVIDEFQTYLGIDYNTMLAELRKYGGSFALATQSLGYLDEVDRSLRATVLSNTDHLFAFAMSAEDAKALAPYLDGVEPADLINQDAYTCYARLALAGRRLPPFSLRVAAPAAWDAGVAAWVRQRANERIARPAKLVDEDVSPQRDEAQPREEPGAAARASRWPDDEALSGLPDGLPPGDGQESGAKPGAAPRGPRGTRGGKGSRTETDLLARPYVGTDTDRAMPRAIFVPRDEAREESGERGGE